MNCTEFEGLINDLACDNLMSVTKRAQAWAHKEDCVRCAARLAEERLLTERLRLVANADLKQTPARVKTVLLAAFAQQLGGAASPGDESLSQAPVGSPESSVPAPKPASSRSRWVWAAAALILIGTIMMARLLSSSTSVGTPEAPVISAQHSGDPGAAPRDQQPEPTALSQNGTQPPETPLPKTGPDNSVTTVNGRGPSPARHGHKPLNAVRDQIAGNRNEVVTDYIPLTYMSNATALDSGLVVRVQEPRSTLISMGLPMNVESSKELVKADVVVGDDGVARAIRLVHDVADGKQLK